MAEISMIGDDKPEGIVTLCDPCRGSGRTLISGAKVLRNKGHNFQRDAFFVAQDIDTDCCHMSFIQFSLLGMPSHVICGNSLTKEVIWQRKTFFYYINNIGMRLNEQSKNDTIPKIHSDESMSKEVRDFLETPFSV